jgi:BirA family biotin operon repressor/biotin-[acetyl-CoA-carboxylase] ligase
MEQEIRSSLAALPLGSLRFFSKIESTNKEAASWANDGAADLALVIADEQTAGRGRMGRRWYTPPDSALAFSLIIKDFKPLLLSTSRLRMMIAHLTGLGALAVCQALRNDYKLAANIKWPNDILLNDRKVGGVLAEAHWQGNTLQAVILGIGVNVTAAAIPPNKDLAYPATCVETAAGMKINRFSLLRSILHLIIEWRDRLGTPAFINHWQKYLAFMNKPVRVITNSEQNITNTVQGILIGLDGEGRLKLEESAGAVLHLASGEIKSLRDQHYRSNNHAR